MTCIYLIPLAFQLISWIL